MRGRIYKLLAENEKDECYVGSTFKLLKERRQQHKYDYNSYKKDPENHNKVMSYEYFDEHGFENCKIILLQSCVVQSKAELLKIEQEWIDKENCINIKRAYITKEQEKEYAKAYVAKALLQKFDCGCGGVYTTHNKARHNKSKMHLEYIKKI
jgi:hypothetical protein